MAYKSGTLTTGAYRLKPTSDIPGYTFDVSFMHDDDRKPAQSIISATSKNRNGFIEELIQKVKELRNWRPFKHFIEDPTYSGLDDDTIDVGR